MDRSLDRDTDFFLLVAGGVCTNYDLKSSYVLQISIHLLKENNFKLKSKEKMISKENMSDATG